MATCEPVDSVTISLLPKSQKLYVEWVDDKPNRIRYDVDVWVFNPAVSPSNEWVYGEKHRSGDRTALITPKGSWLEGTITVSVRAICDGCVESEEKWSNEIPPR